MFYTEHVLYLKSQCRSTCSIQSHYKKSTFERSQENTSHTATYWWFWTYPPHTRCNQHRPAMCVFVCVCVRVCSCLCLCVHVRVRVPVCVCSWVRYCMRALRLGFECLFANESKDIRDNGPYTHTRHTHTHVTDEIVSQTLSSEPPSSLGFRV